MLILSPTFSIARKLLTLGALCMLWNPAFGAHVYYEYGIAKVTAGFDVSANETEIRKFYLAAEGPGNLSEEAYAYCRQCVQEALTLAGAAAYATPGEATIKLGAAMQVWNTSFPQCMSARSFAKSLVSQFFVGITERREREKGLVLAYSGGQFNAELYNLYYKEIDKRLPGGDGAGLVRRFAELQAKFAQAQVVDIHLKVPDEITNVGTRLITIQSEAAQKLVANLAVKISEAARPEKIAEAVPRIINMSQGVALQIEGATKALQNFEAILPRLPNGPPLPNLGEGLGAIGNEMNKLAAQKREEIEECVKYPERCLKKTAERCVEKPLECNPLSIVPEVRLPEVRLPELRLPKL